MKSEIKVLIDEGGIFQGVYVTPDIAVLCPEIELMDFVTDDPDELDAVASRYEKCKERALRRELSCLC